MERCLCHQIKIIRQENGNKKGDSLGKRVIRKAGQLYCGFYLILTQLTVKCHPLANKSERLMFSFNMLQITII